MSKEIFVPDYEWNAHYESPEEVIATGELAEGEEFDLVRLTVGAKTTYRVVNGKPVPVSVAFPEGIE
jgi:hypothetical protein